MAVDREIKEKTIVSDLADLVSEIRNLRDSIDELVNRVPNTDCGAISLSEAIPNVFDEILGDIERARKLVLDIDNTVREAIINKVQ